MAIEKVLAITVTLGSGVVDHQVMPFDLAKSPNVREQSKQSYDFKSQQRYSKEQIKLAGNLTFNSVQTFNYQGQPTDASSDNFD